MIIIIIRSAGETSKRFLTESRSGVIFFLKFYLLFSTDGWTDGWGATVDAALWRGTHNTPLLGLVSRTIGGDKLVRVGFNVVWSVLF